MVNKSRINFISVIFLLGIISLSGDSANAANAYRYSSKDSILLEEIDTHTVKDWAIVNINKSESFVFFGINITGESQSTILTGTSSDFIFLAVISGKVDIDQAGLSIKSGQVAIQQHLASSPIRIETFSARDLAKTFDNDGHKILFEKISPVVNLQKKARFWGLLRQTNANIGVPSRTEIETLRRSYLVTPTVLSAKRRVKSVQDLPEEIARTFIISAKNKNVQAVSELLDPSHFRFEARAGNFLEKRLAFAKEIVQQQWVSELKSNTILVKETNNPLRFSFTSGSNSFDIDLVVFDSGIFVSSITPQNEKKNE